MAVLLFQQIQATLYFKDTILTHSHTTTLSPFAETLLVAVRSRS